MRTHVLPTVAGALLAGGGDRRVHQVCVSCHGDAANLAPEIKERIAREYPADRVTGYSLSQVGGAVSVKRPL